jgi:hypothetical protein
LARAGRRSAGDEAGAAGDRTTDRGAARRLRGGRQRHARRGAVSDSGGSRAFFFPCLGKIKPTTTSGRVGARRFGYLLALDDAWGHDGGSRMSGRYYCSFFRRRVRSARGDADGASFRGPRGRLTGGPSRCVRPHGSVSACPALKQTECCSSAIRACHTANDSWVPCKIDPHVGKGLRSSAPTDDMSAHRM